MEPADRTSKLDDVARDLQRLREAAGAPSYAEVVNRITRQRLARGVPDASARPARTTVYDAFRVGRRRLDVTLVLDIAEALGAGPEELADWAERCRAAQRVVITDVPAPAPAMVPAQEPAGDPTSVWSPAVRGVVLVLCVAVNLLGRGLVDVLHVPLYLDMVGTAVAAVVLGPWWGAGVGASTNLLGALVSGPVSIPFAVVNVVGALVWGYGVRSFGMGRTIPRFFVLNLAVALACTATAVPIIVILLGGATSNGTDDITGTIVSFGASLVLSVLSSNLLTSTADKMISGFVALVALELVLADRRARAGSGPGGLLGGTRDPRPPVAH